MRCFNNNNKHITSKSGVYIEFNVTFFYQFLSINKYYFVWRMKEKNWPLNDDSNILFVSFLCISMHIMFLVWIIETIFRFRFIVLMAVAAAVEMMIMVWPWIIQLYYHWPLILSFDTEFAGIQPRNISNIECLQAQQNAKQHISFYPLFLSLHILLLLLLPFVVAFTVYYLETFSSTPVPQNLDRRFRFKQ